MTNTHTHLKPRLSLTIGVTGHRLHRMLDVDQDVLRHAISTTLTQLSVALEGVYGKHKTMFAHELPQLRMISALADGADTIGAQAALAAGWRVDACLPFARDVYANDFAPGQPYEEFDALLKQVTATFVLDGEHADPEKRDAAYEAVGRLTLEQADVLLAIWDGDPGRGRGGTARVVAEAVARHIPVIHIHTSSAEAPQMLWTGLSDADIEQPSVEIVPRMDAAKTIDIVVNTLAAPPDNKIDQRMLAYFYRDQTHHASLGIGYPLLLAVTGVRTFSRRDFRPASAAQSQATLTAVLATPVAETSFAANLIARYGIADAAATYFAQIFRSGFVANFALAALAVVLSLTGPLAPGFKLLLISIELFIVILIVANTHAGNRFSWHERWMDNRHLAEQLRALSFTSLLGDLSLRAHVNRDAATVPGWVGWLARATARELAIPNASADVAYLTTVRDAALRLIEDQIAYQHANEKRMHKLEHRLHNAGELLFGATIVACAVWIIAKLTGAPVYGNGGGGVNMTVVVSLLTAAMPALGGAIYGIRMQGDFAGIAHRSHTTVARLERLRRAMLGDPVDYARLNSRLRNLADIMLIDVSNWRTTYQARPLSLPG
jgi:hypothetical protein